MVAELAKSASCRGYDGGAERRRGGMTGLVSLEGVQQITQTGGGGVVIAADLVKRC